MSLEQTFDRWHAVARGQRWLSRFAWFNRIVLFLAFLPSGWTKLAGHRFTRLDINDPVGFFFEAMYRTGFYWNFLGAAQLAAGLLLLIPRTQALGALLYFAITCNVFLITVSMHFRGTPVITGLMFLASTFLVCWHYDAWKRLLFPAHPVPAV